MTPSISLKVVMVGADVKGLLLQWLTGWLAAVYRTRIARIMSIVVKIGSLSSVARA